MFDFMLASMDLLLQYYPLVGLSLIFAYSVLLLFLYRHSPKTKKAQYLHAKEKTLQELSYAGCSKALEVSASAKKHDKKELSSEETQAVAVDYIMSKGLGVKKEEAIDAVLSLLGKTNGGGASGAEKL